MINKFLNVFVALTLTGAMVLFGMAWGRYVSHGTSFDHKSVLVMTVLVGALVVFPITGALRTRRR